MARKNITITIEDEGRDKGKTFFIEEWAAQRAERWAMRAFFALSASGIDLPENAATSGMAGIVGAGFSALGKIPADTAIDLLDELMSCVKFVPKAGSKRDLVEEDIQEVATRLKLKFEVFKLHTGFSMGESR